MDASAHPIPTATLLAGYTHQDALAQESFDAVAARLAAHLGQPVIPCVLDNPGKPLLDGITAALRQGAVRIVTLPLFLSGAEYRDDAVADAITYASRRWPFLQFHLGPPPDWDAWVKVFLAALADGPAPAEQRADETVVLLVGRGDQDPHVNGDLAKLARLLYEAGGYAAVDLAFVERAAPGVTEQYRRYATLGVKEIVVAPCLLFEGETHRQLLAQIDTVQSSAAGPNVTNAPCLSLSDALLQVLASQHTAALDDRRLLPLRWEDVSRQLAAELNTHDTVRPGRSAPDESEFQQLAAKIDAILPPRYKGRTDEVSRAPMAAADLVFDGSGAVAWDRVFGVDDPDNPFCELALAGGPSHRGALLEPASAADCMAEGGKYAAVLAEIERGIRMITGLSVVQSATPGWIGVQCDSEEMAVWLMRAVIVENVMVRREADVLYLPAGPHFTLTDQIKSVVTVTAKTWHYWNEHVTYQALQGSVQ